MSPLTFGPPRAGWPDFRLGTHPKPRTYIAGPMRGYDRYNFPAFDAAEKALEPEWQVFSPAAMDRDKHGPEIEFLNPVEIDATFMHDAMRRDILTLTGQPLAGVPGMDAIHLLEGWENSSGVNVELTVARALGLEIYEQLGTGWIRISDA